MMASALAWFWNERFWLPHNVTWADMRNPDGVTFPQAEDLYMAFPLALGIFVVRIIFERCIARPCANALKIQAAGPRKAQSNAILEKVFTSITKNPGDKHLDGLAKQLDWDVRTIQRWFRRRRNQEKPSPLAKFCESMWRFMFYLYVFVYGLRLLSQSNWVWDSRQCWYNHPYQPLPSDIQYYYIVELAFYWSLMFSQFTDIKRKDFFMMFMHHLITVSLISFSYIVNMVRMGSVILCMHDAADFLLEAAKMANYARYQKLCDLLFILFALVFFVTRLGLFPFWPVRSTMFESWEIVGPYPSWWVFVGLLVLLQCLHVIWSYLILRIACKLLRKGKSGRWDSLHVSKDDRSDIESSSDDDERTGDRAKGTARGTGNGAGNGAGSANGTNGHLLAGATARACEH
ncbi:ceramide synthase 6-like isoform X1 [Petromyzon marinus]|uniref:Ceramide synthase 6-like isoform X1 n=1 Tax=Petromyzon marinus TaxID=7757 RepID=A0AAJ7SXS6_PETMA|nr:ceramide synthase 6-like isoform X1 [Petromyzon marinus]